MRNLTKVAFISIISTIILSVFNLSCATTGVVNTPAVRVREKASTDSEILTKAYEGEEIEILEEEGEWYKVKVNGKTGYASKSLIKQKDSITSNNTVSTNTNLNTSNTVAKENTTNNNISTYETDSEDIKESEIKNDKKIIKEDVSLKLLPNFSSNDIKLLTKGKEVEVTKELNRWVEITVDGIDGWILENKLDIKTSDTKEPEVTNTDTTVKDDSVEDEKNEVVSEVRNSKGIVNVETANVREKADKTSSIIAHLDEGDEVTIIEEIGDWYKIKNSEISNGYVSKTLITLSDVTSRGLTETREDKTTDKVEKIETQQTPVSSNGTEVVEFAKKYLGVSYVLGGKTPESGFDCSGYTRYVFKNFGYSLGTVASEQDSVGKEVSREELKEGDLILFLNEGKTKIGHTGIYIGGDQFIHAANPERGVVIDNFSTNSYYSSRFVTARRIVE